VSIAETAPESRLFARLADLERLNVKTRYAVAAGAGLISNLAYAPFFFFPALAVGLTILVWLLDGAARSPRPMRTAFARVWVFSAAYFLGGLYWVGESFLRVDGALIFLVPAVLALPSGLALFWAAASAAAMKVWSKGPARIVVFALAIMAAELVRGHAFGGFPWNLPGYVWPAGGEVSQAASLIGIYGLSLLTVLAMAAPATLADSAPTAPRVGPVLCAALGLGLIWGAGLQRLEGGALNPPGEAVVRVADSGFSQEEKWRPGNEDAVFRAYLDLIDGPTPSHADIIVWPESAVPALLLERPDLLEEIGARLGGRTLITGAVRSEPGKKGPVYFNSAVVLTGSESGARLGQIYNKSHLVPFGEFIPLWRQFEPFAAGLHLKALQEIGSGFEPGSAPARMIVPGGPQAVFLICYEASFPGLIPRGEARPDWIVNVTNDAWFGGQTGPYQHYNQSRYRAIEEGLPLVRSASGGISAIIDPYGRAIVATGLAGGAVEAALPPPLSPTLYARSRGGTVVILFLAALLLGLVLSRGGRHR
jgi:apolipoprotein N-acyltransferase